MVAEQRPQLPLKQYEVALQNAQVVLAALLEQPTRPWVCFPEAVAELGRQVAALQRNAAACRIQRGLRRRLSLRKAPPVKKKPSTAVPSEVMRPLPQRSLALQAPSGLGGSTTGGALNPLERRRQLVAEQLALSNPSRLPRSRRHLLHGLDACSAPEQPLSARPSPAELPPLRSSSPRPSQSSRIGGQCGEAPFPEPLAGERGPQAGRVPGDLLLKDDMAEDDDDLMDMLARLGRSDGAGFSMAAPPAAPRAPGSRPRPPEASKASESPPTTASSVASRGTSHSGLQGTSEVCRTAATTRSEIRGPGANGGYRS